MAPNVLLPKCFCIQEMILDFQKVNWELRSFGNKSANGLWLKCQKNTFRKHQKKIPHTYVYMLDPVCCKKWQKIVPEWPVTGLWNRGPLKDLKDSKLILNESKLFPWSSRINLVQFSTFRGALFSKPVTGHKLFIAVSYSKPALESVDRFKSLLIEIKKERR